MNGPALAPLGTELLDHPDADPALVAASLRNIARANRWFGGAAAIRFGLARLCGNLPRGTTLTLLDIGTGSGDLPLDAARWAASRGLRLVPLGLERHRTAAALAAANGVPTALGCAALPPVRSRGVDVVLVSQVLHHLAPSAIVELLREADRIARRGVVIADLRRSSLAALGFWFGSRALGFDAATRHDGLLSVRRGFSRVDLEAALRRAGITGEVHLRPGFRLVALWRSRAVA